MGRKIIQQKNILKPVIFKKKLVMQEITKVIPEAITPGALLEIYGANFIPSRDGNHVMVGGKKAAVIEATPTMLKVLTDPRIASGKVEVIANKFKLTGNVDLLYPLDYDVDGSPTQSGSMQLYFDKNQPSKGKLDVMVVFVKPSDVVLTDTAFTAFKEGIRKKWSSVINYYDQVSYGALSINCLYSEQCFTLSGKIDDYIIWEGSIESPNIKLDVRGRFWSEAAGYVMDPDDPPTCNILAVFMYLGDRDHSTLRGYGGWSTREFIYSDGSTNIDILVPDAVRYMSLIALDEKASYGRIAHEVGHCIVQCPFNLTAPTGTNPDYEYELENEDLYTGQGIDASAAHFDLMGHQEEVALFSGYNMETLGYYDPGKKTQIYSIDWSPDVKTPEIFHVIAHGGRNDLNKYEKSPDGKYSRCHLLKINVSPGITYYVEVRQQPASDAQNPELFDHKIPMGEYRDDIPLELNLGGVIVTQVQTGTVNNNQLMRYITLMHDHDDPHILKRGIVVDPERNIIIKILEPLRDIWPITYKVQVEWNTPIQRGLNFNLYLRPGNVSWESPDVWVDSPPPGPPYDYGYDPQQGLPIGNGDRPHIGRENDLYARVHCAGLGSSYPSVVKAKAVFYSIVPPGVGDRGNDWGPIDEYEADVPVKRYFDFRAKWTPIVGQHTCLKVHVQPVEGETDFSDNAVQENVAFFDATFNETMLIPSVVTMQVAVRNPLNRRVKAYLQLNGLPEGFVAYFPNASAWLDPLGEKILDLMIIPTDHYSKYFMKEMTSVKVRLSGYIMDSNASDIFPDMVQELMPFPIGGITARVEIKELCTISMDGMAVKGIIVFKGKIGQDQGHCLDERVYVEAIDSAGNVWAKKVGCDENGNFTAAFHPGESPYMVLKDPGLAPVVPENTIMARAVLTYSRKFGQAESGWVNLNYSLL